MLQVIEYNGDSIVERRGTSLTMDGSNWSALIDVDYSQGVVYNHVKADYIAVTSTGKVAAFKVIFGLSKATTCTTLYPKCLLVHVGTYLPLSSGADYGCTCLVKGIVSSFRHMCVRHTCNLCIMMLSFCVHPTAGE